MGKVVDEGLVTRLPKHLTKGDIAIFQYAHDTILPMQDGFEQATNMKFMLCLFEEMSCLKTNYHKSKVFCTRHAKERTSLF